MPRPNLKESKKRTCWIFIISEKAYICTPVLSDFLTQTNFFKSGMRQIHDRHFDIFISSDKIQERVRQLAATINTDYKDKEPLFLSILNGAFIFTADLVRSITIPAEVSFIKLKSYRKMESSGKVAELLGLEHDLANRHVIIVEDIVDTGKTLDHILAEFGALGAQSIEIVSLLFKPDASAFPINLKYIGFEIPNRFVVGYGLDYDGYGRNLKDIYKVID
jgi:hypoxanthine phosphoribosyltransferase